MRSRDVFLCPSCGRLNDASVSEQAHCRACGRHVTRVAVVTDADRDLVERMVLGRSRHSHVTAPDDRAREKLRALQEWRDGALGPRGRDAERP